MINTLHAARTLGPSWHDRVVALTREGEKEEEEEEENLLDDNVGSSSIVLPTESGTRARRHPVEGSRR